MILKRVYPMLPFKIFHNITIKYCVWHYKRSFEVQKNKLCYNEVENNHKIYLLYKLLQIFLL